jgi:2-dehydropantoate 2-reductase
MHSVLSLRQSLRVFILSQLPSSLSRPPLCVITKRDSHVFQKTMSTVSSSTRLPLHILGAGSIGQLFAASIRSKFPSYPVTLLLRETHRERLNSANEMTIVWKHLSRTKESATQVESSQIPVEYLSEALTFSNNEDLPPIQNLVVATKSYQATGAVKSVLSRLTKNNDTNNERPRIILLCNGALSVKEDLERLVRQDISYPIRLVLATTTHGAYREQNDMQIPGKLIHAGYGRTFIEESGSDIGNLWNEVGLNSTTLSLPEMNLLLWKKLAANCVINPLTAIYRCTNEELLMEPSFPVLQAEILTEILKVMTTLHVGESGDMQNFDVDVLRDFVNQVIQDTSANRSSMYQDVVQGHPTEIDHLNGYVVRKGRDLKIECPANEDILQRVKGLERV